MQGMKGDVQYSEGVKYLFINGVLVLDNGKYNNKLPAKVILLKKSQ